MRSAPGDELAALGGALEAVPRAFGEVVTVVTVVVLVVGAGSPAGTTEGLLAGWDRAALGGAVVTLLGALLVAVIRPARTP
jgi:hypothetical protein